MRHSAHAKRMAKRHVRRQTARLNLVSLMDIFTILVFFLLVNSSDVEVLQKDKDVSLPDSVSEQKPDTQLIISVSASQVLVGGRPVAEIADLDEASTISGLKKELSYQALQAGDLPEQLQADGRAVTIMADKDAPYNLLKKIMATCAETDYRNISLAVNQVFKVSVQGGAGE